MKENESRTCLGRIAHVAIVVACLQQGGAGGVPGRALAAPARPERRRSARRRGEPISSQSLVRLILAIIHCSFCKHC